MVREFSFDVDEDGRQWNWVFQFGVSLNSDGTALDVILKILHGDFTFEEGRITKDPILRKSLNSIIRNGFPGSEHRKLRGEMSYMLDIFEGLKIKPDLNKIGLGFRDLKSTSDLEILDRLTGSLEDQIRDSYDSYRIEIFAETSW